MDKSVFEQQLDAWLQNVRKRSLALFDDGVGPIMCVPLAVDIVSAQVAQTNAEAARLTSGVSLRRRN